MNFLGCKDLVLQQHHHHHHQEVTINSDDMHMNNNNHTANTTSSSRSSDSGSDPWQQDSRWALKLLRECARAISEGDTPRIQQLLWMLNELASPYGDRDQKLASYFLQALFCKATNSGKRCYQTLSSIAHTSHSFDSARRLILKFQEVSPWTTFGHVASNGAILEALDGHPKLHIVDISNTLCTQWPTLLEALATRNDDTPHLKLTLIFLNGGGGSSSSSPAVMKEVRQRMEKFARLMGVPFELNMISSGGMKLKEVMTKERVGVEEGEAVAVNCVGAMRRVRAEERGGVMEAVRALDPKVVTLVEEEADVSSNRARDDFVNAFEECLRFFSLYFDTLEKSFGATSNERLMLERDSSRSIVRVLACTDDDGEVGDHDHDDEGLLEEWERGRQWSERMRREFRPLPFSDDVLDDVKALLKRYKQGWSLSTPADDDGGIYLRWKDHPVVWASAWKP